MRISDWSSDVCSSDLKEVMEKVKTLSSVPDAERNETNKNGQSKHENKVGWARFYLAKAGLIDGRTRARWALTAEGLDTHPDHESALTMFPDVQASFRQTAEVNRAEETAQAEDGAGPQDDAT